MQENLKYFKYNINERSLNILSENYNGKATLDLGLLPYKIVGVIYVSFHYEMIKMLPCQILALINKANYYIL